MGKFIDITGQKFGRLTVIGRAEKRHSRIYWACRCECGNTKEFLAFNVRSGHVKSCGCLHREAVTTHGNAPRKNHSPEYRVWAGMITRTTNANPFLHGYGNYMGRGIAVCERWLVFENFLEDMGRRPGPHFSIDRIDNDGNYCPENCRWATKKEQSRNTRANKMVTYNGETKCLAEWVDRVGIPRQTIRTRLRLGWTVEKAFETPVLRK